MKRITPPRSTGTWLAWVGADRSPPSTTRRTASASRSARTGFEHVVDRLQVEGVDGVLLVRGDEHDRRRRAEPGQHLRELGPVRPGIWMSRKTTSTSRSCRITQALGGGVAGDHLADPVAGEEVRELVEGGALVVHDQDA